MEVSDSIDAHVVEGLPQKALDRLSELREGLGVRGHLPPELARTILRRLTSRQRARVVGVGLDTYATTQDSNGGSQLAPDEPFEGLRLCGGMHSGGADSSSIRGKVYAEVVAETTGESLYEERIEPPRVAEMARRLRDAVEAAKRTGTRTGERQQGALDEQGRLQLDDHGRLRIESEEIAVLDVGGCEIHVREAEDLARWFEICAERGYAVEGWW